MAPWLVLRPELQGGNTNFPLIASLEGSLRAGGLAGEHPRATGWAGGGAPVLTGGTRGNPSILHACNIQPSSGPVQSPASVGASAEPLGMGSPVRGWTDSAGAGLGPAPELQAACVSPLP